MLADKPGRTPAALRERLVIVDAVQQHTRPGTHLFYQLRDEAKRLRGILTGTVTAPGLPVTAGGWEVRSTPAERSESFERYAAAEAEWQLSQERQQLLAQRPKSWQLPPRAPKRLPNGEAPSVRLDADTERRVTVHISKSAMAEIVDECPRCGEYETGGWLVGHRAAAWHADHSIVEATVAAKSRARSSVALDASAFLAMDERLVSERRRGAGHGLRVVGDWHSHPPGSVATPSDGDIACWARDLATLAESDMSLTSLIVTQRDGCDSWARPVITAWITRHARSSFGERMVVEPASVRVA